MFSNRDESAWNKGELAYDVGDTMEIGVKKAAQAGYRPGCNGYSAFITAFARRVRSKQALPKEAPIGGDASGVVVTGDFTRAA
jgi:hypothetical protein